MKKLCLLVSVAVVASLMSEAAAEFPEFSAPRAITGGPKDHFFASYYAINAWSPDNRYALVLETDIKNGLPDGREAVIGVVDTKDGDRFIPFSTTRCWNFQEAAMAYWLPGEKDTVVFNDMRDGKFCAVVMNWKTKAERIIPHPIAAVSEDGKWAISINYARLFLTRPDYGYHGEGQDPRKGTVFPEDDGLWRVNLRTGEAKLIVSCAAVKDMVPAVKTKDGMSYLCHVVISKDMKRIYFLSRSVERSFEGVKKFTGVKWQTTAFTCNADGSGIRRCFPDGWGSSHFNWKPALSERDARTMTVTANWQNRVYTHVEFTVGEEDKVRQLGKNQMNFDGHCLYTPDGKFVSGDGYWDGKFFRHWKIVRLEDDKVGNIGKFYVPPVYRETYSRCDLHPRWRPDGRQIGFNSVHEGSRQVYVMDVVKNRPYPVMTFKNRGTDPVYTVPYELDMLIKAGHIQGACCSEQGVYLSHQLGIAKIGWDGKLIKTLEAPAHLGDTAYADGKIYGAFVIRDKKLRKNGMKGLVRVWNEDLEMLAEKWVPEALDGITVLGDTVYVGVDRWGRPEHPLCCVKRLSLDLEDKGNVDVDLGFEIAYGVQTMSHDGKDLYFGCYGGTAKVSPDLKKAEKVAFGCSEGFDLVPESVTGRKGKIFFAVRAMGGNMQGWRKDPLNNPPRIRLDFFELKDGKFVKPAKSR